MSCNGATALAEMGWTTPVSLAPTIDPTESTNTETAPQVDFPSHRSCQGNYINIDLSVLHTMIVMYMHAVVRKRLKASHTSSDVVPVGVIWCKLLESPGFHNVRPVRKLHLS